MEEIQSKKTKNADEKYCSECGEIIKLKAEICPKCGVRQSHNLGAKFLYSAGVSLLIFLVIVLATTPQHRWLSGLIGSCIFAFFSGAIAMAIPTIRKIIYLPISISIMLLIAMIIGMSTNK